MIMNILYLYFLDKFKTEPYTPYNNVLIRVSLFKDLADLKDSLIFN